MFFGVTYIWKLLPQILKALLITFMIVLVATVGGLILGLVLAVVRLEKIPILNQISIIYNSFIQGTPVTVQLFIFYYGVPALLSVVGIDLSGVHKIYFMYIAYGLNTGAYLGEIIRAAIANVPKHQFEAAYASGLTKA